MGLKLIRNELERAGLKVIVRDNHISYIHKEDLIRIKKKGVKGIYVVETYSLGASNPTLREGFLSYRDVIKYLKINIKWG